MTTFSRRSLAIVAAASALALLGTSASVAQQRPKITASSIDAAGFQSARVEHHEGARPRRQTRLRARRQSLSLDLRLFYAAFSTGETEALIGGPTILQKLYQEGVPLRIFGTGFTLADLVVFAKDPNIKSLADLKGKQLAADMGGSQFQVIKIYTNAKDIDLGKDITVVNANFAVARAQLEADRVDAALVIEPLASITL